MLHAGGLEGSDSLESFGEVSNNVPTNRPVSGAHPLLQAFLFALKKLCYHVTMIKSRQPEVEMLLQRQEPLEHTIDELRPGMLFFASQADDETWPRLMVGLEATFSVDTHMKGVLLQAKHTIQLSPMYDAYRFRCGFANRVGRMPRSVYGLQGELGPDWLTEDGPGWPAPTHDFLREMTDEAGGPEAVVQSLKAVAKEHTLFAQLASATLGAFTLRHVAYDSSMHLSLKETEVMKLQKEFINCSVVSQTKLGNLFIEDLTPKQRRQRMLRIFTDIDDMMRPYRTADMPQEGFEEWDKQRRQVAGLDKIIKDWGLLDAERHRHRTHIESAARAKQDAEGIRLAEAAQLRYGALEEPFVAPSAKSLRKTPYWPFMQAVSGHPPRMAVCPQLRPIPSMSMAQQIVGTIRGLERILQDHPDDGEAAQQALQHLITEQAELSTIFDTNKLGNAPISTTPSISERVAWLRTNFDSLIAIRNAVVPSLSLGNDLRLLIENNEPREP